MNQKTLSSSPIPSASPFEEWIPWSLEAVTEARSRTLALLSDLDDEQLFGSPSPITNPFLWEFGHVAWFQEKWILRHVHGDTPCYPDSDELYDSSEVAHDTRWDLPLRRRADVIRFLETTRDRVLERLRDRTPTREELYFVHLSLFHEDMHTEAFTYMRQTLGYPAPPFVDPEGPGSDPSLPDPASQAEDAAIPGGTYSIGSHSRRPFVFDNEQWSHPVEVGPFRIAKLAVTQSEFAEFVEQDGYRRREFWDEEGWRWREETSAEHPVYWRREPSGNWMRHHYTNWIPLEPNRPVVNVNWHEARAYCRFRNRRLPTEAEWEIAASAPIENSGETSPPRRYPWGEHPPTAKQANLDWASHGCIDVHTLPAGDSPWSCRQMIGNVWEWTETPFRPYPGFEPGPYKDYSRPWFESHKSVRGGSWATRARMIHNARRNYYLPDRRDVWTGFRTCAL